MDDLKYTWARVYLRCTYSAGMNPPIGPWNKLRTLFQGHTKVALKLYTTKNYSRVLSKWRRNAKIEEIPAAVLQEFALKFVLGVRKKMVSQTFLSIQ